MVDVVISPGVNTLDRNYDGTPIPTFSPVDPLNAPFSTVTEISPLLDMSNANVLDEDNLLITVLDTSSP